MCFCINIHLHHGGSLTTMQLRYVLNTSSRQRQDPFLTSAPISSPLLDCMYVCVYIYIYMDGWPWVSEFRVWDSSMLEPEARANRGS